MASPLKQFALKDFSKGYNSLAQSKTLIDDKEFAFGQNVELDNNGSVEKRLGSVRYGPALPSSVTGRGQFHTSSVNALIVSSATSWYRYTSSLVTGLSGATFTANLPTDFVQASGRVYGGNGTDPLSYTPDASTVTQLPTSGTGFAPVGKSLAYYSGRLWSTDSTNSDYVWFSNIATNPTTIGNFGTFDTNLTATPVKNASFIELSPGSGVEITRIFADADTTAGAALYVYTKRHGIWKVVENLTLNADNSVSCTISQINTYYGTPAPQSVLKVANDQEFYGGDNQYSLGEVALYNNIRVSTKTGRIQTEMQSVVPAGKPLVANGFYKTSVYTAYQSGSYNDRMVIRNTILNAFGAPRVGINASWFLDFLDADGVTHHLLAGSANPNDPYVYELESGLSDAGTPISAYFETKSTDCGYPGLVKRLGFITVFCALVYGTLTYEVFSDESSSVTGSLQVGTSATGSAGFGTQPFGSFPMGMEYSSGGSVATSNVNGTITIPCNYTPGTRFSVRFSNANAGEQFRINGVQFNFLLGSIYENVPSGTGLASSNSYPNVYP